MGGSILTAHLELVALTARFVRAVQAADRAMAGAEIGARVGTWMTADPSHIVQLYLAAQAAEAEGFPGLGRAIVLSTRREARRLIGSIGFHGPPDELGRLEASCRIHPAHQSRGYAAEAYAALLDWATERHGVDRFVIAIAWRFGRREPVPVDVAAVDVESATGLVGAMAHLLEPKQTKR